RTQSPSAKSFGTRTEPIYPAPPVTRTISGTAFLLTSRRGPPRADLSCVRLAGAAQPVVEADRRPPAERRQPGSVQRLPRRAVRLGRVEPQLAVVPEPVGDSPGEL